MRILNCWLRTQGSATKLTVLISSKRGRYRDEFDRPIRLPDPGGCKDLAVVSIGRRMDQGLECSSNTVGDESPTAQEVNASIYNNLGHIPDFIPWNEHELIILRMAFQVDCDYTTWIWFSIRVLDWNLDVIVGCSVCTGSRDAGKVAPR